MPTKLNIPTAKSKITGHKRPEKIDTLEVKNLHAKIDDLEILKGLNLSIKSGEIHAVMGPNGSGKSTLCKVLMGHPKYKVTGGSIKFNGRDILKLKANERANLGLFLGFQHPVEIPGVTLGNFLRLARAAVSKANGGSTKTSKTSSRQSRPISPADFLEIMKEKISLLKMDNKFMGRSINESLSGGEKKRTEIIQMSILEPKMALLDEIDSGLDIDALKIVAENISTIFKTSNPGIMVITHYQRILNYIKPDFVHIMTEGKIIKSGDHKLALELEKQGYKNIQKI